MRAGKQAYSRWSILQITSPLWQRQRNTGHLTLRAD